MKIPTGFIIRQFFMYQNIGHKEIVYFLFKVEANVQPDYVSNINVKCL